MAYADTSTFQKHIGATRLANALPADEEQQKGVMRDLLNAASAQMDAAFEPHYATPINTSLASTTTAREQLKAILANWAMAIAAYMLSPGGKSIPDGIRLGYERVSLHLKRIHDGDEKLPYIDSEARKRIDVYGDTENPIDSSVYARAKVF